EERFEQPIVQWISFLFASFDHRLGAICQARNLLCQPLVPQFPAKTVCHELGDFAASASIFPFDSDDFDHINAASSPESAQLWTTSTGQGPSCITRYAVEPNTTRSKASAPRAATVIMSICASMAY